MIRVKLKYTILVTRYSPPVACVGLSPSSTLTKIFILSSPARLQALHRYSPLSFLFTWFTTRVWFLRPLPDRIHVTCGVGSPVALQFNFSLSPALREMFLSKELTIFGGSTGKKCAINIIKENLTPLQLKIHQAGTLTYVTQSFIN